MRITKIPFVNIFLILCMFVLIAGNAQEENSENIEDVFDSFFSEMIELDPELATQLGVPKELGLDVSYNALTDISPAAVQQRYELYHKYYSLLDSYNTKNLSESQRLAHSILLWHLNNALLGKDFKYHDYVINPIFGVHNNLTTLMTEYHSISNLQNAKDYLTRLEKYEIKFKQLHALLDLQKEKGILPPKFIIDKTHKIMSDFISMPVEENVLYTSFRDKLIKLDSIQLDTKLDLYKQLEQNINQFVYPSYQKHLDYLADLQKAATLDAGVWKLPEGDDYYIYCLKSHTTTDLTPQEIHELGLKEVQRIQEEAIAIFRSLGFTERRPFGLMVNQYWRVLGTSRSSKYYYPNTDKAKKRVLRDYQNIIAAIQERIPDLFSLVPKTKVTVKSIPKFKEISMGAHYEPASLDGSREGIFYVNLVNLPLKPGMKSLTYHEAIPGHHFQIALQQESTENRLFRNLLHFTAFIEGWALYAEKLGMEYDWYDDPNSKLGYLDSELLRAVRLVLDTGLHYKGWDREKALQYMQENLGWGSLNSIDRYIVWPGQACAYKIGELKILELRELAQKKLGDNFDIKEFHQIVLKNGALPLDILEKQVNNYITLTKN